MPRRAAVAMPPSHIWHDACSHCCLWRSTAWFR